MSILFVIAVVILIGASFIGEYKQVKRLGRGAKWTYWVLLAVVAYIVIARRMEAQINLPTEFFVHSLAPFVQQMIP